ncbi:hypothetical protein CSQ88_05600 [Iodobacter sp. BJB302]|nr:hypothetical protein CSQ88_05600 [Iodobacter sp. BJB302]
MKVSEGTVGACKRGEWPLVGRLKPAAAVLKSLFSALRHGDLGAVATAGAFLSCFAKKGSERRRPHETRRPLTADN